MNRKIKKSAFLALFILITGLTGYALAQSDDSKGQWGGIQDIMQTPVGARAMAMGGAYVSVVNDPYALFWNPAALENAERVGFGVYHTGMSLATDYNFFSFIYPTLDFGTFSAGLLRISTGDVMKAEPDASKLGTTNYSKTLFMFGYGFRPASWFYLGTTFKVERTSLPNYGLESNFSESALGGDLGMMIKPQRTKGLLSNFAIGMNIQSLLQRTQRVVDIQDKTPRNFLFGMSKGFGSDASLHQFLVAYQFDINGRNDMVPTFYHYGFEYDFRKILFLRMGYDYRGEQANDANWKFTYGFGLAYYGIQFDYSYWNERYDVLSSSHRISMTYNIGKTRKERIDDIQKDEQERIRRQVEEEMKYRRHSAIITGMEQARMFYDNEEYARAYGAVTRVLTQDQTGTDPDLNAARQLLADINTAIKNQQEHEFENARVKTIEEADLKRQQQEINLHYDKASAFFGTEDYQEALRECEIALQLAPTKQSLLDLKKIIEESLNKKIADLTNAGVNLERSGRYLDAIQKLNEALQLAKGREKFEQAVSAKITQISRKLDRDDILRRAKEFEIKKDYANAAEMYKEALKTDPKNDVLKQNYDDMYARSNAKNSPLTGEAKELYSNGLRAFNTGNYDEALRFYEDARKIDPYNMTILRAIDFAKERKRAKGTSSTGK